MDHIGMAAMYELCYQEAGKMRLIDLDKTIWNMRMNQDKYDYESYYGYRQAMKDVAEQPTVKAIPIDWITKWAEKFYKVINGRRYYEGDGYDTIWDMLEAWEKENGKD